MRLGVLSDVHGNRHALEAVLGTLDGLGIDRIICLGDVVGYGPDPADCLDLLRSRPTTMVLGNHEEALLRPALARGFRDVAREAIAWTRRRLRLERPDLLAWLAELPGMTYLGNAVMCVHDSPAPGGARYLVTRKDAIEAFPGVGVPICFVGHTHLPSAFQLVGDDGGSVRMIDRRSLERVTVDPADRWILNPGSVGQPRDGDPRASFAVLDLAEATVEWERVAYDIGAAQRDALRAGLPPRTAERLAIGA